MTIDQAHTCYIRHCVRAGGRCICALCERYRARVEAEAAPAPPPRVHSFGVLCDECEGHCMMKPAEASRTNALALVRLGVFQSVLSKFGKET